MKVTQAGDAASDIAKRIKDGQPVMFVVGSYISYRESGLPGVNDIVRKIWSDLRRHPAFEHLPDWIFQDVAGNIKDARSGRVQFEVYFQLYEEHVGTSLSDWAIRHLSVGRPGLAHRFLATLAESYSNVDLATTNFDRLLEEASTGLASLTFSSGAVPEGTGVYKLHGSVDDPQSTVLNMRRIAVGLPLDARNWLGTKAAEASMIYLGWSGNDFDIYPTIREAPSAGSDVFTIRPQYKSTDREYEEEHWRQIELQKKRKGTRIVAGYAEFLKCLAAELNYASSDYPEVAALPLSNTPIVDAPVSALRNYLLALLEYAGEAYSAMALLGAFPADDVRSRSLHRRVMQASGQFDDMARQSAGEYLGALIAKYSAFERLNCMSDWSTARCNQRYIWHFFGAWRGSRLARRLTPATMFDCDIQTRAMQHWAVGVVIMADVLTRGRIIPGAEGTRAIAERLFHEVSTIASQCGDMYRKMAADLELLRSMSYTRAGRQPDYIERLAFSCRELAQLGRGHDVTVYIERGLKEAQRTNHELRPFFADMLVRHLLVEGLRGGGAMVVVKGLRFLKHVRLERDLHLFDECFDWADRQGQFGLWRPRSMLRRSAGDIADQRQRAVGLAERVEEATGDLVSALL